MSTGRESDKFMLRLPDGMRDRLKQIADDNHRSMNAEVVSALEKWIEDAEYHKGLDEYYAALPEPERPPEGWQDDQSDFHPPSEDWLLEEKQRQFANRIATEAADRLFKRLVAAGIVAPKDKT